MSQQETLLIKACVLSLASNIHQTSYLQQAANWLLSFGTLSLSAITTNQDKHNSLDKLLDEDSLTYFNQVAFLQFAHPIDYWQWVQLTKNFEQQQHRQQFAKPQVTLDIDVVAIQLADDTIRVDNRLDEKGQKFLTLGQKNGAWLGIQRRFPLASYDLVGLQDLAATIDLDVIKDG